MPLSQRLGRGHTTSAFELMLGGTAKYVSSRKEIYPVDKSVIDADNDQGDNSITKFGKIRFGVQVNGNELTLKQHSKENQKKLGKF